MTVTDIGPAPVHSVSPTRGEDGALRERFRRVRSRSEALCEPLSPEDFVVQSMPDVSPTKWHLAHTSWFFETFVLAPRRSYRCWNDAYAYLFNSYYNGVGKQYPRPQRGLLSRPTVSEIWRYRAHVDEHVVALLDDEPSPRERELVELGLHHEQQHQELLLTDIKHVLAQNPLRPSYGSTPPPAAEPTPMRFVEHEGGVVEVGHQGPGFCFDNERPRHRTLIEPFSLGDRLVTVGEYRAFIEDGGYRVPELWLSEGWDWVQAEDVAAPLYWRHDGRWLAFTLAGERPLDDAEPVTHLSMYEADAFARWAGARLPREHELEVAAADQKVRGNFVEDGTLHPRPAPDAPGIRQLFGDGWEWTQSSYAAYPGYQPPAGAVGEYNGKFMCNQYVLRGGSCATPGDHLRPTYRNFFPAHARWQFTCIRLAKDGASR